MEDARSYSRGHEIYYDWGSKFWRYVDNEKQDLDERPCKKCGCYPTAEGYDACKGHIKNAKHACCGHGLKPSYVIF